jgi:hypothetical protein
VGENKEYEEKMMKEKCESLDIGPGIVTVLANANVGFSLF